MVQLITQVPREPQKWCLWCGSDKDPVHCAISPLKSTQWVHLSWHGLLFLKLGLLYAPPCDIFRKGDHGLQIVVGSTLSIVVFPCSIEMININTLILAPASMNNPTHCVGELTCVKMEVPVRLSFSSGKHHHHKCWLYQVMYHISSHIGILITFKVK